MRQQLVAQKVFSEKADSVERAQKERRAQGRVCFSSSSIWRHFLFEFAFLLLLVKGIIEMRVLEIIKKIHGDVRK